MKRFSALLICVLLIVCLIPAAALADSKAPTITENPANITWPEGSTAYWSCLAEDGNPDFYGYHWYIIYNGKTYDACDYDNLQSFPWFQYGSMDIGFGIGAMENSYFISGIQQGLDGAEIYCIAENQYGSVTSAHALISVVDSNTAQPAYNMELPAYISCECGDTVTLTSTACFDGGISGHPLTYTWYQADSTDVRTCIAINRGQETEPTLLLDTSYTGTYYYFCGVFAEDGEHKTNYSYSGAVCVEVMEKEMPDSLEIMQLPKKTTYLPGEYVDLSGLKVRMWTNMGYQDLTNNSIYSVRPECMKEPGKQTVIISYLDMEASFSVEVTGPETPVIDIQPSGGNFIIGKDTPALSVKAHTNDNGDLKYQWYSCTNGQKSSLKPIAGATSAEYKPNENEGTVYFSVSVRNSLKGTESEEVFSELAIVNFTAAREEPKEQDGEPVPIKDDTESKPAKEETKKEEKKDDIAPDDVVPAKGGPEEPAKKNHVWVYVIAIIIVAGGAGGAIWYIQKKK